MFLPQCQRLHPPYIPDLSPSNFHLFDPLNGTRWRRRLADDDELKHGVREGLRRYSKEFYATGFQRLMQKWKKGVDSGEDSVKK